MPAAIPYNRPFMAGNEQEYIAEAVASGNIGGDGVFTRECSRLLESQSESGKVLMTPSCTAALEMSAMLCRLNPGDEVILPSYTFVSTVNAFVRAGARPKFVDIRPDTLNLDESAIEAAITPRTRVIVPVHYNGVACEMDAILAIAARHRLRVVEDAAQAVYCRYKDRALGSIGDLGTFSFHETKCFICGEGGALCINDPELIERAEILRDKGTNRSKFFRGEVDKYTWVDTGSSYVPSEIACAYLCAQLEQMDAIVARRRRLFEAYVHGLQPLASEGLFCLPHVPPHCRINYHLFYLIVHDPEQRDRLIEYLRARSIQAVFHYVPLHDSPVGRTYGYRKGDLPVTEAASERIVRLPMYFDLSEEDQSRVIRTVYSFFGCEARLPRETPGHSLVA